MKEPTKKLKVNKSESIRKSDGVRDFNPDEKPVRFRKLTLELDNGLIYEVKGLQIKEMNVVTPMVMSDGPGVPKGEFIKSVGPQEVTIVFQVFGTNAWPSGRHVQEKPKQIEFPKLQLPEHK